MPRKERRRTFHNSFERKLMEAIELFNMYRNGANKLSVRLEDTRKWSVLGAAHGDTSPEWFEIVYKSTEQFTVEAILPRQCTVPFCIRAHGRYLLMDMYNAIIFVQNKLKFIDEL